MVAHQLLVYCITLLLIAMRASAFARPPACFGVSVASRGTSRSGPRPIFAKKKKSGGGTAQKKKKATKTKSKNFEKKKYQKPHEIDEGDRNVDDHKQGRQKTTFGDDVELLFPPGMEVGMELPVRLLHVTEDYAIGRPACSCCSHLKGKLSRTEVSNHDYNECENMLLYYAKGDIIYTSIKELVPPDRLEFSVRRVRNVLRDDFYPHTVVVFKLPWFMDRYEVATAFSKFGNVMEVELHYANEKDDGYDDFHGPSFITFEHKEDAMKAIKNLKWVETTYGGETTRHQIRIRSAHRQEYKETLQAKLDQELAEKIELWDETPEERRARIDAENALRGIIPWPFYDKETEEQSVYRYMYPIDFNTRILHKAEREEPKEGDREESRRPRVEEAEREGSSRTRANEAGRNPQGKES